MSTEDVKSTTIGMRAGPALLARLTEVAHRSRRTLANVTYYCVTETLPKLEKELGIIPEDDRT